MFGGRLDQESCLVLPWPDKAKGGLDLSSRANLLEDGSRETADEGLLYREVAPGEMPPKKPLSPQQSDLMICRDKAASPPPICTSS